MKYQLAQLQEIGLKSITLINAPFGPICGHPPIQMSREDKPGLVGLLSALLLFPTADPTIVSLTQTDFEVQGAQGWVGLGHHPYARV